jgi:glycosyltransferase involved in cell wall biosynthesis
VKVLIVTYNSIGQHFGGLQVQIFNTKKELENLGHFVKLFDPWNDKIMDYDIIHFFSFLDTSTVSLMQEAKRCGKLIVMSTVYNDILNVYKQKTQLLLSKIYPTLSIEKYRQQLMIEYIDLFVFLSSKEEKLFEEVFKLKGKKSIVIKNGVENLYLQQNYNSNNYSAEKYKVKDYVLHVGQFTKNKNQLVLIKALADTNIPLIMIGDIIEEKYYQECCKCLTSNMKILPAVKYGDTMLLELYKGAKLFALPSFKEAYPLTVLEAGLQGTKVLLTENSLFDDENIDVTYCNPHDERAIREWIINYSGKSSACNILNKGVYSWKYQISLLDKEYKSLIEK